MIETVPIGKVLWCVFIENLLVGYRKDNALSLTKAFRGQVHG